MRIVCHGDIDGLACAAIVILNVNKGRWCDVEYALPSGQFDPTGAIVLDLAMDRNQPSKSIAYLDSCEIWIDHHSGWTVQHPRLLCKPRSSCAEVVHEHFKCSTGWDLVEIARQCDTGFPTLDDALVFHKTLKTDFVSRAMKDLILACMIGKLPVTVLEPYVRHYDRAIDAETMRLFSRSDSIGNVGFVLASTHKIYDKSKLLSLLYADHEYGVVISRKNGEYRTTIATRNPDVNLLSMFNLKSGSPSRVTMKGHKLLEILEVVS